MAKLKNKKSGRPRRPDSLIIFTFNCKYIVVNNVIEFRITH